MSQARMDRFRNCGSGLWLLKCADDLRLSCNKCHDRFCAACAAERAGVVRHQVQELARGRELRMMTLTLRHSHSPLKDQLRRLKSSFKELRRRQAWKHHVRGGVAFLELKLSSFDGLWHVHLHLLVEGRFFPHQLLSSEWLAVTGDSSIVHIAQRGTPEQMGSYAAKYCTKPCDSGVYNVPDKLDEMIKALRGEHLYMTFGTWRNQVQLEPEEEERDWHQCGNVFEIAAQARRGDEASAALWEAAVRKWPSLEQWAHPPPDQ